MPMHTDSFFSLDVIFTAWEKQHVEVKVTYKNVQQKETWEKPVHVMNLK
jgi:hypothetical protein